jgi:hypothetical protein
MLCTLLCPFLEISFTSAERAFPPMPSIHTQFVVERYSLFAWLFIHARINARVLSDGVTHFRNQECADIHLFKGPVMGRRWQKLKNASH